MKKMQVMWKKLFLSLVLGLQSSLLVAAQGGGLTIEISKGVEAALPIAIVPFAWTRQQSRATVDLAAIVKADLTRSGLFKALAERDMLSQPSEAEKVRFKNWRVLGQDYLLIGKVEPLGADYQVQFQLFDVYKSEQLLAYRLKVAKKDLRRTAHHISDVVYQKLTGKAGVFSSRIAYITTTLKGVKKQKQYNLMVADADGFNPRRITYSHQPLMSPAWSPDGKKIAYVSFENKRAAIYVQTLASGRRSKIAAYPGINGAPAFSPDGKQLALTLSKDGSPDIYVVNLQDRKLKKLTHSFSIDTEPAWSPDGEQILFTSDRGGKPQLYTISSSGGRVKRLTYTGDYNSRGGFSADGKSIVMVHANKGDYRIAVMDVASRTVNVLTAGKYDESPSFSTNGEMILYASKKGRRSVLSAVSVDGKMQQSFSFDSGDVREPAWSN